MIHFVRPWWALAFIVLVFVYFFLKKIRNEKTGWEKICDPELLDVILVHFPAKKKSIFFPIILCTLVVVALMGPAFQKLPQPTYHKGQDVLFALDVSLSSSLTDVNPSRLTRSLFKLHDLSEKIAGTQMGLVLYADTAFTAIPLTPDKSLLQTLLPTVQSGIMGEGLASISSAIKQGVELLSQAQSKGGNILIFAASNDETAISTAKKAFEKGYKVSVIAVGTNENTPLLRKNGKFLTKNGKTVLSALDEKNLAEIATAGGGIFVSITEDETDLNKISAYILNEKINSHEFADQEIKADVWQDLGVYIILVLLPFIALLFRKGILFSLILLCCTPAKANMFVNPEYTEAQKIIKGENPTNPEIFKKNDWKSIAWYKWNNYEKVIELLKNETNPENIYNLGNALALAGKLKEAIEAYNRVLAQNPEHEDALFNKKLVEDLLKEQEKNQQNQNQNQDKKNNQDKQDKKDQNDQQNKDNKDNQSDQNKEQNQENKENNDKQNQDSQNQNQQDQQNQSNADSKQDSANNEQKSNPQNQQMGNPEEQQGKQEQEQVQQQGLEPDNEKSDENRQEINASAGEKTDKPLDDEQKKWLNLIPDDPSALLRARIYYHNMKTNRR